MPNYVYRCAKCELEWEVNHKITEEGPTECPRCQSPKAFIDKVIQAVGSILKGSGWYKDGY